MKPIFQLMLFSIFFPLYLQANLSDYSIEELCALGKKHRADGNYQKALCCFRAGYTKAPENREISLELAFAHLACEHFNKGFELLDHHFRIFSPLEKQWNGEPLENKRILVHVPSWGYGDLFMFLRFARSLKHQGSTVYIFADNIIVPFLQMQNFASDLIVMNNGTLNTSYFGNIITFDRNKLPSYDYEVHLCSLPAILKASSKNLFHSPYIEISPERTQFWSEKMRSNKKFKIGVCWQGADRSDAQLTQRSIPFEYLKPLLQRESCDFYCLQTGDAIRNLTCQEKNCFSFCDQDLDGSLGAFVDTAAIIANLDLVITVDTSIAHLAGAMGKKVFVLLPYAADWRYHINKTNSPWYPTMRLFRQSAPGDWDSSVRNLTQALEELLRS